MSFVYKMFMMWICSVLKLLFFWGVLIYWLWKNMAHLTSATIDYVLFVFLQAGLDKCLWLCNEMCKHTPDFL